MTSPHVVVVPVGGSFLLAARDAAQIARSRNAMVLVRDSGGNTLAAICPGGRVYRWDRPVPYRCDCCGVGVLSSAAKAS